MIIWKKQLTSYWKHRIEVSNRYTYALPADYKDANNSSYKRQFKLQSPYPPLKAQQPPCGRPVHMVTLQPSTHN